MTADGDQDQILRAFGLVSGIGIAFAVCLGFGLILGLLAAKYIGGGVAVVALGLLVGILAGGRTVYRMTRDISKP